MEVAVSGVSEVSDADVVLIAQFAHIHQELGYLIDGNNNVHLVKQLCIRLDSCEEAASGLPDFLLECRCIYNQNVKCAGFFGNFRQALHLGLDFFLAVAD